MKYKITLCDGTTHIYTTTFTMAELCRHITDEHVTEFQSDEPVMKRHLINMKYVSCIALFENVKE